MDNINKIGKMALMKYFSNKTSVFGGITYISKVVFSKEPISLEIIRDYDNTEKSGNFRMYEVWSIELGIISLNFKDNQTLYHGIVRRLKKLQKEDAPSHLIVTEHINGDKTVTMVHTIYRFTHEQELTIFHEGLLTSIEKRCEKCEGKVLKEQKEFKIYYERYLARNN